MIVDLPLTLTPSQTCILFLGQIYYLTIQPLPKTVQIYYLTIKPLPKTGQIYFLTLQPLLDGQAPRDAALGGALSDLQQRPASQL